MINFNIILESCLEEAKKNKEVWGEIIRVLFYVFDKYKNMDVIETAFELYFTNRKITRPDPRFYDYLARKKREAEGNIDAGRWTGNFTEVYNEIRSKVDPIIGVNSNTSKSKPVKLKSRGSFNQKDFIKELTTQTEKGYNRFVIKFAFDKYIDYLRHLPNPVRSGWWTSLTREEKYDLFENAAKYPPYDEYRHRLAPWDKKRINTAFEEIKRTLNPIQGVSEKTQWQKYHTEHPNPHHQSLNRTVTGGENRNKLTMSSKVHNDKNSPYELDVLNQAEESEKVLTPKDMQEISKKYQNIDWNDRREKKINSRSNMTLVPLPYGKWKSVLK